MDLCLNKYFINQNTLLFSLTSINHFTQPNSPTRLHNVLISSCLSHLVLPHSKHTSWNPRCYSESILRQSEENLLLGRRQGPMHYFLMSWRKKLFQQWQVEIIFWYTTDQVIVYVLTFPEYPLSRSSVIMLTRPPGQTDLEEMILFLRGCSLMFLFYSNYKCPRRLWHTRTLIISKTVNNPESAETDIFSFIVICTTLFPYLRAWLASCSLGPFKACIFSS